ncbi:hypothetical protein J2Y69_003318 [Microbacterium resistens]|uniref:Uncharacterized protein n=1 Tax=Microbacterium resistens TaxID=156977 RepID=A0ABU1SGF5_9MICO|nr:hypothetical protein [Microbacterium resistens]MDR6868694.1 hypothetical protein [Microbacterium resistens]
MPNLNAVEEAARDHVYHLRHREFPLHTHGPEDYIQTPLLRNLDHALAALLEHLTDIGGGVEGITNTFAILADHAMRLPGAALAAAEDWTPALELAYSSLRFEDLLGSTQPIPILRL